MKTIKKAALFPAAVLLMAAFPAAAFAQTAERLDAVLAAREVSCAQAAAVLLPAAGLLDPAATEAAAFDRAREWLPRRVAADAPVKMGELSRLVMGAFGLSGGLMYRLFPGPRYGYRAMAWRRFLPARSDPGRTVTGEELFYIIGRVLSWRGEPDPVFDPVPEAAEAVPMEAAGPSMRTPQGEGLSSGDEGVLPYAGEFEIE